MNLKEIVDLCKSGQALEAYEASRKDLATAGNDQYALIGAAYGTKAMMEHAVSVGDAEAFVKYLNEFAELHLEDIDEREFNNKVAWAIRSMILKWKDSGAGIPAQADDLFDAMSQIAFQKPHRYYSVILDSFLKLRDEQDMPWRRLPEVVSWWGLENLLPEDYERVLMVNGRSMSSLAERVYTASLKILCEEVAEGRMLEAAESMLGDLETLEQIHPEYDSILYRKSKLLAAMGRKDEALSSAAAYARKHPNLFRAWSALGDIVEEDRMKAACYSRALLCKVDPMFQVKVRYKLAVTMYNIGEYPHSKREFEKLAHIYDMKGWHMPQALRAIMGQQWYQNTYEAESNRGFYNEYARFADQISCQDVPAVPVLINMVNPQKMVAAYVTADRKRGYFSMKKLGARLLVNNLYMMRYEGELGGEKATKVLGCEKIEDVTPYEDKLFRRVKAEVGLKPGQTFQFVDDIYIDGNLLRGIRQGTMAEVVAVLYYNVKKESWGWRAVAVRPETD